MRLFEDLKAVALKGDNLRAFQTDWDFALEQISDADRPSDQILENLYREQIEKSHQIKGPYDLYKQAATFEGKPLSYERLYDMVEIHLEDREKKKLREQHDKKNAYPAKRTNSRTPGGPTKHKIGPLIFSILF